MHGAHRIKHWSTTQSTVALSSAEAELTGICKGAAQSMGLRSLASDLGMSFTIEVKTDAMAAIGICKRRGLGKVRHLHTADLWVQDKVRTGAFTLKKIAGENNTSDVLTKFVPRPLMNRHLQALNLRFESGRSSLAPTI